MGCAKAGFHHLALVEHDKHSCHTIRENQQKKIAPLGNWHLHQMDVTDFDYSIIEEEIDLKACGPPCQPFSIGGRHGAFKDKRDMFPQFLRAVRALHPKAFLIENVRGLLRQNFLNHFEYIILQLTHPELLPKPDELWADHLARLERHHNSDTSDDLGYRVTFRLLNASGLWSVGMVVCERRLWNKTTIEVRFYISSLEYDALVLAHAVRSHWGIENSVHWILDVTFNEDASRIRKDNAPLNFSVLRRLSLNLLSRDTSVRGSIAIKRYRAGLDNNYLAKIIATV